MLILMEAKQKYIKGLQAPREWRGWRALPPRSLSEACSCHRPRFQTTGSQKGPLLHHASTFPQIICTSPLIPSNYSPPTPADEESYPDWAKTFPAFRSALLSLGPAGMTAWEHRVLLPRLLPERAQHCRSSWPMLPPPACAQL